MSQDNVVNLIQPAEFSDPLTEVLREGARALLAQAVEAEVAAFLAGHAGKHTEDGRQRLVRHGHRPERAIMTGLGPVAVRAPRVRDRSGAGEGRIRFTSAILPPYARRSKSLEVLIPILYLKGISSGDFEDALSALLGPDAGGLSASSITRLREAWSDEHARWSKRDLSGCGGPGVVAWTLSDSWRPEIGRSRLSEGDQAAIIFSLARGMASRKVCIGVLPKHQRPWCGLFSL